MATLCLFDRSGNRTSDLPQLPVASTSWLVLIVCCCDITQQWLIIAKLKSSVQDCYAAKKSSDDNFLFLLEDRKSETFHRLEFEICFFFNISVRKVESLAIRIDSIVYQRFV